VPGLTQQRAVGLPAEVTGFVGRRAELARLAGLLESARLVTVTGPGGVGKTRVSLRAAALAAAGYADGVFLAELGGLRDAELLSHTVAAALGLPQSEDQLDAVLGYLRERQLLLILDTCEHLLDACAMLTEAVLRAAPGVTVLAASRQPLDVPGEYTCPIPPLPVDAEHGEGDGDAVKLFTQRAAAVVPGFTITEASRADVVRICRRLDGIPLAIELATVRLRALPLGELAYQLERRFRVLDGDRRTGLPRHKTLRTAIEWSHNLCTPGERLLWARLSVFAGSFDLTAAETICAHGELDRDAITEALIGLVDKSVLLREEGDGGTRYRLLDTLREFAAEQLASSGREPEFRARHLDYYLAMAEQFHQDPVTNQLARYRALGREHANTRAALEASLEVPGREDDAARLALALTLYWYISATTSEAEYWLDKILPRFPGATLARARVLLARCRLFTEDVAEGGKEGIAIAERLGAEALAARGYLYLTGALLQDPGNKEEASRAADIAAERLQALGDQFGLLWLDLELGGVPAFSGEPVLAIARLEQGLRRAAGSGEVWVTSYLHQFMGFALFQLDEQQASVAELCQALTMKYQLGDVYGMAYALEMVAWLAVRQRRYERSAWLLGASAGLWEKPGATTIDANPFMREPHRAAVEPSRKALGADRYTALYQAGYDYPLDQLIPLVTGDADQFPQASPEAGLPNGDSAGLLTTREREIAVLVAKGMSHREIAERLVISKRTVDAHVEHIYTKLGISSRVQLVNWLKP
jgi:predicted ATPase/DNA-binding CsgD family transcriptional regulator